MGLGADPQHSFVIARSAMFGWSFASLSLSLIHPGLMCPLSRSHLATGSSLPKPLEPQCYHTWCALGDLGKGDSHLQGQKPWPALQGITVPVVNHWNGKQITRWGKIAPP